MTEEYILKRDVIGNHTERMTSLKKYYPYFRLIENDFSQFQGGKYDCLDMGYLVMAVLRFFMEENNFREKDVTYEEYSSFIKEIYERDFGLVLEKAEEQSLSSYIFDKITNEGRPFVWTYYDPEERMRKSARVRLIESRMGEETVSYRLTSEAVEFYLDTKEIREESAINVSQVLLAKMIAARNFRGGMEVVRRMNNQVARLKMQRDEVLELLGSDVFEGVKAYEEFMETGTRWFAEEQKMFRRNMELIDEALRRADSDTAYGQAVKDIYDLENELKRALVNHSRLLDDCTRLQIQADEMISGAKFSRLKKSFDFKEGQRILMEENDSSVLQYFIKPLLKLHVKKRFSLASVDKLLTLRPEREEKGERIREEDMQEIYISDDEREEQRIRENYILCARLLLYYISVKDSFEIKEWCGYVLEVLGEHVLMYGDFYSMLIHLAQKSVYCMEDIQEHPDTFFEEYLQLAGKENPQYGKLKFRLEFLEDEFSPVPGCVIWNFKIIKEEQEI